MPLKKRQLTPRIYSFLSDRSDFIWIKDLVVRTQDLEYHPLKETHLLSFNIANRKRNKLKILGTEEE